MDVNSVFGGDSLKAADLQGQEVPVVIASVEMKKFDNGNKLVLRFQGKQKCLICNKERKCQAHRVYPRLGYELLGQPADHPRYRFCRVPG